MATIYVYNKNNLFVGRKDNINLEAYELADNESINKPQTVYEYDDSYHLTGLAKIKPGTVIANATHTVPPDGLNDPTYDPANNTWHGISNDEYRKLYNVPASEPDGSAKLINALTQQVFQLTQKVNQLEKSDQNG
ncbi:hypothetical protein ACX3VO_04640 [Limosilactobacillus reuteri subsp. reuteri]|uniref:Uncharacterized protein n=4 Tax=Limosilactobacillus reuteri TaxID=1598 RepID=A5VJU3_LIMRD|nr:hypothetical protein [Limosilactobacillus reuteri]MRN06829.1 hypothetical protein [Lactobacillus sp. 0.1XD8-4]ABQ83117.1 hypothetical protein Lreu_0854 [Limosilactobacillus reuteri subsp. reuteri]AKP01095.1 hypothetical protein LRIRT_0870 [Limosilactobacillus reuteri]EGC15165.1 hypothetical protein HMPREF0536_10814 [Limosilactobacillus reuteri MM4-1A]MCC4373884.1 hypothetical protein [Limosilactobacillus reuteri]